MDLTVGVKDLPAGVRLIGGGSPEVSAAVPQGFLDRFRGFQPTAAVIAEALEPRLGLEGGTAEAEPLGDRRPPGGRAVADASQAADYDTLFRRPTVGRITKLRLAGRALVAAAASRLGGRS